MKIITRILTTLAICGLLVACDDDTSSQDDSYAINPDNAENIVFGSNEAALRLNDFSITLVEAIHNAQREALVPGEVFQFSSSWAHSDSYLQLSFTDNDGNGQLSSGDVAEFNVMVEEENDPGVFTSSSTVEIKLLAFSVTEDSIVINFNANTHFFAFASAAGSGHVPGLYNPLAIDRSDTQGFTPFPTEEPVTSVATSLSDFSLAGDFQIDFSQSTSDNSISQTINLTTENLVFDYLLGTADLVIFSDQLNGAFQLNHQFHREAGQASNSLFRDTEGNLLPTAIDFVGSGPQQFASSGQQQNEFYISGELKSFNEDVTFSFISSQNLLQDRNSPFLFFNDGKILYNSLNSFATQFSDDGEWLIENNEILLQVMPNYRLSPAYANTFGNVSSQAINSGWCELTAPADIFEHCATQFFNPQPSGEDTSSANFSF